MSQGDETIGRTSRSFVLNWNVDKDIIDKVHRRGARFVCNEYRRDCSVTEMLESLGWDSLENSRCKSEINMTRITVGGRVLIKFKDYFISGNADSNN